MKKYNRYNPNPLHLVWKIPIALVGATCIILTGAVGWIVSRPFVWWRERKETRTFCFLSI